MFVDMRKMNESMVTVSWIITGIFTLLLLIRVINFLNLYGNREVILLFPVVIGMVFGSAIIPGVFWLITYFSAPVSPVYKSDKEKEVSIVEYIPGNYNGGHNSIKSNNSFLSNNLNRSENPSDGQYRKNQLYK